MILSLSRLTVTFVILSKPIGITFFFFFFHMFPQSCLRDMKSIDEFSYFLHALDLTLLDLNHNLLKIELCHQYHIASTAPVDIRTPTTHLPKNGHWLKNRLYFWSFSRGWTFHKLLSTITFDLSVFSSKFGNACSQKATKVRKFQPL